jgi:hypothetical protein
MLRKLLIFSLLATGFSLSPAIAEEQEACTINKMQQAPIASTAKYAVSYELDIFCPNAARAIASAPLKKDPSKFASVDVSLADLSGNIANSGESLLLQKGQNTIYLSATAGTTDPGKYEFSLNVNFFKR